MRQPLGGRINVGIVCWLNDRVVLRRGCICEGSSWTNIDQSWNCGPFSLAQACWRRNDGVSISRFPRGRIPQTGGICVEERAQRRPSCQLRLLNSLQCLPAAYPQNLKTLPLFSDVFRFRPESFGKWIYPKRLRGCTVRWAREILSWNCERNRTVWKTHSGN